MSGDRALDEARWPSIRLARRHDPAQRLAFEIDTPQGPVRVGSVARADLPALARWPSWLQRLPQALRLAGPCDQQTARLAAVNAVLREAGLVRGWRDETYAIVTTLGAAPLALIERAAARFWGTLSFGAHANAYVADAAGRPTHLWVARRSHTKPTDPGLLDNLIGGGVPHGQTPLQALVREGWEEAGLLPAQVAGATPGRIVHLLRDLPEGLQHEHLHSFDLPLPGSVRPCNQDGEVAELWLAPVAQALDLASGNAMTVDASLVTLDFGLRHGLLRDPALAQRADMLWHAPAASPIPGGGTAASTGLSAP